MNPTRFLDGAITKSSKDDFPGSFEGIASSPTLDRDNEVIDARAFLPLPREVPIHFNHNTSDPVGVGQPVYRGDDLWIVGRFGRTDRAQEIRSLSLDGIVSRFSVGFHAPQTAKVDGITHIKTAELLEISLVTVPSNRQAELLAVRSYQPGPATVEEARRLAAEGTRLLAELAMADVRRALDEIDRADAARLTPAEVRRTVRRTLADADAFLADLNRRDR